MSWNCMNCFSSGSSSPRPSRRLRIRRDEDGMGRREAANSTSNHGTGNFAEISDATALLPMPSEDVVNEKFTKMVVGCNRTS